MAFSMKMSNRPSVSVKSGASNASLETAPKAVVKKGSPMFAATSTTVEAAPASGMNPGMLGGMAAMFAGGALISKMSGGGGGDVSKLQAQQAALSSQLQQQQASMQQALAAQASQLQAQQAQQLAKALEGKGMSAGDAAKAASNAAEASLEQRAAAIRTHFPTALAVDDFVTRTELALAQRGITGDNSIAMTNFCRDESCMILEDKIEAAFGACFSTHGLGGVLTCGTIGIMAGASHSPVMGGKEQYVFFSFPHIAIDSLSTVGKISRPNRPGSSSACGALCACLADFQKDGLEANCRVPGVHDAENPEYSILKQRLARQLKSENCNPADLDLVKITQACERTITNDLEHLISQAVDTKKANYAVITGTQIHNWSSDFQDPSIPSMEFCSVGKCYTVIDGVKQPLDVTQMPSLAPRQIRALNASMEAAHPENDVPSNSSAFKEIPRGYMMRRVGGSKGTKYVDAPMVQA